MGYVDNERRLILSSQKCCIPGVISDSTKMPRPPVESCAQCRARKVKCDNQRPLCHNCRRLNFDCSFDNQQHGAPALSVPARRRGRACLECRSQKIKCRGTVAPCPSCLQRNKHCIYPPTRRPVATPSNTYHSPSFGDSLKSPLAESSYGDSPRLADAANDRHTFVNSGFVAVPDAAAIPRLTEVYFAQVYPSFYYSFISPKCLENSEENRASHDLRLAVCIITATLLQDPDTFPAQAEKWAQQLEHKILSGLESLSFPVLQAIVLLVRYRIETGKYRQAFMLTAIAARAIFAMRLNYEKPAVPSMARELRRRLVWSMAAIEVLFAIGVPELNMISRDFIHLNHPQSDESFFSDSPNNHQLNMFGLFLEINKLREDFMRYFEPPETSVILTLDRFTRGLSAQDPASIKLTIIQHENALWAIECRIQEADRYSPFTLQNAANQTQFLSVSMAFHQTYCDMLRLFLTGYREAASPGALADFDQSMISSRAQQAVYHALANITMAKECVEQCSHLRLYDVDPAICVYHAAQIVSFASQPGGREIHDKHNVNFRINWCLQFLKVFYPTSEFVKPMARDIESLSRKSNLESVDSSAAQGELPSTEALHGSTKLSIHSLLRRADFSDDDNADNIALNNATAALTTAAGIPFDVADAPEQEPEDMVPFFDPWMGWQGSLDPFGYLQISDNDLG